MSHLGPELHQAIQNNDMNSVIFTDPFGEETRKSKRNLMGSAFVGLLIAMLHLRVSGFLGLTTEEGGLGNEVAAGLAFLLISYFLIAFVLAAYIDLQAWHFKQERQLTRPYLELLLRIDDRIHTTGLHIEGARSDLNSLSEDQRTQDRVHNMTAISKGTESLKHINVELNGFVQEVRPLIRKWETTVRSMERLSARFRARLFSLWILDIAFPVLLALWALYLCGGGFVAILSGNQS
ncbi:hypothetical protein [Marinobacter sp. MMG032]|uniref:SMODS and SLOG-associating 2TM effector domain-containing protein n=1 Tax=Marinobacter sp. MMG032 TaxID=3158548 RepID=A0AAU7MQ19_9GAMM